MKILSLRSHGRTSDDKYCHDLLGFNSRLDTIQAAVLLEKMKIFDPDELHALNHVASIYTRELRDYVKVPCIPDQHFSSWAQYTIGLENNSARETLKQCLESESIPSMIYYSKPLHKQQAMKRNYTPVDLQVSEHAADTVLSLPIHPFMTDCEIAKVTETIKTCRR